MSNNPSPDVYLTEINKSQRVRGASTSIGAIVGVFEKGPVNQRVFITNQDELAAVFGNPDPKLGKQYYAAHQFLSEANQMWVTRVVNTDLGKGALPLTAGAFLTVDDHTAASPIPNLHVFDGGSSSSTGVGVYDPFVTHSWNPTLPGIENILFMVCAIDPGKWNDTLYVRVRSSQKALTDEFDSTYDDPYSFYLDVFVGYKNVRQAPVESFLVKRTEETNGQGDQMFIEQVVNKRSNYIRVRNNPYAPAVKILSTASVFFSGGTLGKQPNYADLVNGWNLYADQETVTVNILIQGGDPVGATSLQDTADLQRKMIDIAESRMDCIAVLDVPSSEQDTANAVTYMREELNADSTYAAMYSPDLFILDTINDIKLFVPPSGFVASRYAYTDLHFAEWFAPAGMVRGDLNVNKARNIYRQGHRDALNDAHINAIRFFPTGAGYKIWGADTMAVQASALSYVNVRRLLLSCESSIKFSLDEYEFDPNDRVLRSAIVSQLRSFLQPIQDGRGLYWFDVICDESNNKPATIAAGDLYVDVFFDPVICAKRITLRAHIMKTGVRFTSNAA